MRTVGQYSEAIQILVTRLRGAKPETRQRLTIALFEGLLAKSHNGKVKNDIHRLMLDLYPEIQTNRFLMCSNCFCVVKQTPQSYNRCDKCGREGIDYYSLYFGDAQVPPNPSPAPQNQPENASKRCPVAPAPLPQASRPAPVYSDPASKVLNKKAKDAQYELIAESCFLDCRRILDEYCKQPFDSHFYPFPSPPFFHYEIQDNIEFPDLTVVILTSATVEINGQLHYLHPEVNGRILKSDHDLIVRMPNQAPVQIFADLSNGEKRCVRAIRYEENMLIRYWLHEIGGRDRDIAEGEVTYLVKNDRLVQINKQEYWRQVARFGKKRNRK